MAATSQARQLRTPPYNSIRTAWLKLAAEIALSESDRQELTDTGSSVYVDSKPLWACSREPLFACRRPPGRLGSTRAVDEDKVS